MDRVMNMKLTGLIALLLFPVSCADIVSVNPQEAICMTTKAPEGSDAPCRILIVRDTDLGHVGTPGYEPYYETWLPSIEKYSDDVLFTHRAYPSNYDNVHVCGFSPSVELDDADVASSGSLLDLRDGYRTVAVLYDGGYDNAMWKDVMTAGPIVGSSLKPLGEEELLEFSHSVISVSFRAMRSRSMKDLEVMNVRVTFPWENTPYELSFDRSLGGYYATGREGNELSFPLEFDPVTHMIPLETDGGQTQNYAEAGPFYICRDDYSVTMPRLHFSLDANYTKDKTFHDKGEARHYDDIAVEVYDSTTGRRVSDIRPGHRYVVTVLFDQDSFEVMAVENGWEEGGGFTLSVDNPISAGR